MQPSLRACFFAYVTLSSVLTFGCGEAPVTVFTDSTVPVEASTDLGRPPDRAMVDVNGDARGAVCTRSSQCDDGVVCTTDFCAGDGRCVNLPSAAACDDNVYCNGIEQCDVRRGCIRSEPVACNDNYTCTIDRCDEITRSCSHVPRDFDRDGDPDIRCHAFECGDAGVPEPDAGVPTPCWRGGDCDDQNSRVSSTQPEVCGDMIDNNCNGLVDMREPGGCQRPRYDRCDDALDVSRGGRFVVPTAGTVGDYMFRCVGGMLMRDVVLRLRLDEPRDVELSAETSGAAIYLAFEDRCGTTTPAEVRECTISFPSTVYRAHALPAGEYFVLLGMNSGPMGNSDIVVNVNLRPASPVASNDTCRTPTVIPETGGMFTGDLIGVADDVTTRCGGSTGDVVYSLTLTAPHNVTVRAIGGRTDSVIASITDNCARSPMTLRCESGSPAEFTAHRLNPGTYYVIVEGRNIPMFTLDVAVTDPTAPPAGDNCDNPLTLTPGLVSRGSLLPYQADITLSCSGSGSRDVVYSFTLTERRDVFLTGRGGVSDYFYMALERRCGDRTSETSCRFGTPVRLTARGLDPGTYFVVLKGLRPTEYELSLELRAPTAPVAVTGNDDCMSAATIPSVGGLFTGSTAMLRHDYVCPCSAGSTAADAVFRMRLDARQRVSLSTEGSGFDTVLWMNRADSCPGTSIPGACNDDAIGLASAFEVTLGAGDYYVFLGGFTPTAMGPYQLSVTTSPP